MKSVMNDDNQKGCSKMLSIIDSIESFFKSHYELRFNALTERYEYRTKVDVPMGKRRGRKAPFLQLDRRAENSMIMEVIGSGVDCFDRDVKRYLYSNRIPVFHPIKDFLTSLPRWDLKNRVDELAQRISGDKFWMTVFHRWMLGLVAQWSGLCSLHGHSMMPILISARQGKNKSTFCRSLLPPELRPYYTDNFDITAKSDPTPKLAKFGLINVDEVRRFSKEKMDRLKNILQYSDVNTSRPYQHNYSLMERLASFIGTSNFSDLLTDPSGPRRFFPIVLKERIGNLHIAYRQLYAQLKAELESGMRHWFTPFEETRIIERNKAFSRAPIEENLFFSCYRLPVKDEHCRLLPISQIYDTLRRKSPAMMRDIKPGTFGEHLAMIGVEKEKGKFGTVYKVKEV